MERRILKTVEETRQVGANTLTKLHAQHEQLNSVSAAQVKVSQLVSVSTHVFQPVSRCVPTPRRRRCRGAWQQLIGCCEAWSRAGAPWPTRSRAGLVLTMTAAATHRLTR